MFVFIYYHQRPHSILFLYYWYNITRLAGAWEHWKPKEQIPQNNKGTNRWQLNEQKTNRVVVPKFNFDFANPSSSSRVQVLGSLLRTNGTKFYNKNTIRKGLAAATEPICTHIHANPSLLVAYGQGLPRRRSPYARIYTQAQAF